MAVWATHVHCFGCGRHWSRGAFLAAIGSDGEGLPTIEVETRRAVSTDDAVDPLLSARIVMWHRNLTDPASPRAWRLQWLRDKYGLWPETIERYQLGHTGTKFSLPIWQGEEIVGIRWRLDPEYVEQWQLDRNKYIQPRGQPGLIFRPRPDAAVVVITEGEFDALAVSQLGYDALTVTTGAGSLAARLGPRITGRKPVYVATDLDRPGEDAYRALCEVYGRRLPRVRWPHGKDITEALTHAHRYRQASHVDRWLRDADDRLVRDAEWE